MATSDGKMQEDEMSVVDMQLRNSKGSAYSNMEKLEMLSKLKILSIQLAALGVPIVCIAGYYSLLVHSTFFLALLSMGIVSILLGIYSFSWSTSMALKLFNNDNFINKVNIISEPKTLCLFNFSVIFLFTNLFFCLCFVSWISIGQQAYKMQYGEDEVNQFNSSYLLCMKGCVLVMLAQEFTLGIMVFTEYVVAIGLKGFRITSHILVTICTFLVMLCFQMIARDSSSRQPIAISVSFVMYIVLVLMLVSTFAIGRKNHVEVAFIGFIVLMTALIGVGFASHFAIREAQSVKSDFEKNWTGNMQQMNEVQLRKELKCEKYQDTKLVKKGIACPNDSLATLWEEQQGIPVESRDYKIACLNQNCAGTISQSLTQNTSMLGYFLCLQSIALTFLGAVMLNVSLVSRISPFRTSIFESVEGVFAAISLLTIIMVFFQGNSHDVTSISL